MKQTHGNSTRAFFRPLFHFHLISTSNPKTNLHLIQAKQLFYSPSTFLFPDLTDAFSLIRNEMQSGKKM